MNILIDNKSGTPIYDQIFTQIKGQILGGELKTDEPLPSIRGLAKDLRISFITTKRAYEELEKDGFIYTIPANLAGLPGISIPTPVAEGAHPVGIQLLVPHFAETRLLQAAAALEASFR